MLKHVIHEFDAKGHTADILIKRKDILEDLVRGAGMKCTNILPELRKGGRLAMATELAKRETRMFRFALTARPDILVGTSAEIAHVGRLLGRPSVVLCEDDADVVPLFAKFAYPFATDIVSPRVCSAGRWESKKIAYDGYQKLAYLHPRRFAPNRARVESLLRDNVSYFVIRLVKLNAHHDRGIRGLDVEMVRRLISMLKPHGGVYISSEAPLPPEFQEHRLPTSAADIHHVLFFADMFLGDSQSMAMEAAILGTPTIRFNDFAGRISVLSELEDKYKLAHGIKTDQVEHFFETVARLLAMANRKEVWSGRRQRMLRDKIDVSRFLYWFVSCYPESAATMRLDPTYDQRFLD